MLQHSSNAEQIKRKIITRADVEGIKNFTAENEKISKETKFVSSAQKGHFMSKESTSTTGKDSAII